MPLTKIDDRGLTTPIDLQDDEKIRFGTGNDLEIYHNGAHTYIQDVGTGGVIVASNMIQFQNAAKTELILTADENGAVQLYHDNSNKFQTVTDGVRFTGHLHGNDNYYIKLGNGNDLQLYHNGTHSRISNATGNLEVLASQFDVVDYAASQYAARFDTDGAVELYHNGSKKFQTNGAGVDVFENLYLGDNVNLKFGTSSDLQIYHDGSYNIIKSNNSHNIEIKIGSNTVIKAGGAGEAQLLYAGSKKVETTNTGATVTGLLTATSSIHTSNNLQVNSDSGKLKLGASQDLEIYHNGTASYLDNSTGPLYLRGGTNTIQLNPKNDEWALVASPNAGVELAYDGIKKFETLSNGTEVHGHLHLGDNYELRLGNVGSGGDLKLYHNGSGSYIDDQGTGELIVKSNSLSFTNAAENEYLARFFQDSGVELYNNGSKKWATGSNGVYHDCDGTLHQQAIHFETGQNTGDYSTLFGVTNYPDNAAYDDQNDGHWARIQSKGGTVIVINSDAGGKNDGRNNFDHFSIYQRAGESTNGKRLFSVDGEGAAQFGRAGIRIDNSWGGQPSITVQRDNNDGTDNTNDGAYMRVHGIGQTHGSWTGGSTGADFSANFMIDGSTYATSDRRAKTAIVDCPYGLDVVNKLQPRKYQLVNSQLTPQGDDNINLGFIAQEIKEHIPECVNYLGDEANTPNEKGWARAYALDIGEVIPVLVKAVQELSAKVAALEAK